MRVNEPKWGEQLSMVAMAKGPPEEQHIHYKTKTARRSRRHMRRPCVLRGRAAGGACPLMAVTKTMLPAGVLLMTIGPDLAAGGDVPLRDATFCPTAVCLEAACPASLSVEAGGIQAT
jgi:hypothetical protein